MKRLLLSVLSLLLIISLLISCSHQTIDSVSTDFETQEAPFEGKLLNGQDISKFTIIYSDSDLDYSKRAAESE